MGRNDFCINWRCFTEWNKRAKNRIVVASRKDFNTLQIWIRGNESKMINNIENCMRDLLQIPSEVNLDFRPFFKNNKSNWNKKKYS